MRDANRGLSGHFGFDTQPNGTVSKAIEVAGAKRKSGIIQVTLHVKPHLGTHV